MIFSLPKACVKEKSCVLCVASPPSRAQSTFLCRIRKVDCARDGGDATHSTQDFSFTQAFGKLNIMSDPTGAQVVINSKPQGVTPLKIDSFPVGTLSLIHIS